MIVSKATILRCLVPLCSISFICGMDKRCFSVTSNLMITGYNSFNKKHIDDQNIERNAGLLAFLQIDGRDRYTMIQAFVTAREQNQITKTNYVRGKKTYKVLITPIKTETHVNYWVTVVKKK